MLSEDARCCHVAGQGPRQGPGGAVHLRPLLQAEPIHTEILQIESRRCIANQLMKERS